MYKLITCACINTVYLLCYLVSITDAATITLTRITFSTAEQLQFLYFMRACHTDKRVYLNLHKHHIVLPL